MVFLKKVLKFLKIKYAILTKNVDNNVEQQKVLFDSIGLNRDLALDKLNSIFSLDLKISYDENVGMFSEHLVLFSAFALSGQQVKNILEIGTFDGLTTRILSKLFTTSEIFTIDLPESTFDFINNYNRKNDLDNFIIKRDRNLKSSKNINFKQMNSCFLCFETKKFDLIWVDGAHGYPVVAFDIINAIRLCNSGGLILIDDVYVTVGNSDSFYQSIAAYQVLQSLKAASVISDFKLIPKRIAPEYNLKEDRKFVALINQSSIIKVF